jgi:hypothetical protein
MTEEVEPKKKPRIPMWLRITLIVLGITYFLLRNFGIIHK